MYAQSIVANFLKHLTRNIGKYVNPLMTKFSIACTLVNVIPMFLVFLRHFKVGTQLLEVFEKATHNKSKIETLKH